MKKIIILSVLFLAIIAGTIISCTKSSSFQDTGKSGNKKAGQLINTSTVTYPVVTKYQNLFKMLLVPVF